MDATQTKSKTRNKIPFSVTLDDGETLELAVVAPNFAKKSQANIEVAKAYRHALESKVMTKHMAEALARQNGDWSDELEKEYNDIQDRLVENGRKLGLGGIKKSEARAIAIQMRIDRMRLRDLSVEKNNIDNYTAEAIAEQARFDYLVSVCLVYNNDGRPYFDSVEEYHEKASDPVAILGAAKFAFLYYGIGDDFESKLPENQFLLEHGFVNGDLSLVNKDGHLVDVDGRLINEMGRYVDAEGNLVDMNGHRVDMEGNYIVDKKPFIDD